MNDNHLGAGIDLYLIDNVSNSANSIIQSFRQLNNTVDDYINKFNQASNSTQDMERQLWSLYAAMEAGQSLTMLGNRLVDFGMKGIDMFVELGKQVANTTAEFERYKAQLATLFHETDETGFARTEAELKRIQELAKRTPFDTAGLVRAANAFRVIGVDPFQLFEDRQGNLRELILFAGDLAGAFGKSVSEAQYAIKEALTGNWRSMAMRFDTPRSLIEQTIGRQLSDAMDEAGIQDRLAGIVEYINLKYGGGMEQLAGTTEGILERLRDQWEIFLRDVGEAGFMKEYKDTLIYLADLVDELEDTGVLGRFSKTLSDILTTLWRPIDRLIRGLSELVSRFGEFASSNPVVAKFILGIITVTSVMTIATGAVFQLTGGFLQAAASLAILNQTLGITNSLSMKGLFVSLGKSVWSLTLIMLKAAAVAGILYFAWNKNLFGIRDTVTKWADNLQRAFKEVEELHNTKSLEEYFKKWDRLSDTAKKFEKFQLVVEGVLQAFSDDTIEDMDLFEKLEKTGALRTVEKILDLRYNLESFFEGLADGIESFWTSVKPTVTPLLNFLKGLLERITGVEFDIKADPETWRELGESIGYFAGIIISLKVVSLITGLATSLMNLFTALTGSLFTSASANLTSLLGLLGKIAGPAAIAIGVLDQIGKAKVSYGQASPDEDKTTNNPVVKGLLQHPSVEDWAISNWATGNVKYGTSLDQFNVREAVDYWGRLLTDKDAEDRELARQWFAETLARINEERLAYIEMMEKQYGITREEYEKRYNELSSKLGSHNVYEPIGYEDIELFKPYLEHLTNVPGMASGGQVKEGGLVNLHPGEVVVTSEDVRKISKLVDFQERMLKRGIDNPSLLNSSQGKVVVVKEKSTGPTTVHLHFHGVTNFDDFIERKDEILEMIVEGLRQKKIEDDLIHYRNHAM